MHTKGPWYAKDGRIWSEGEQHSVCAMGNLDELDSNAALIAAAPELLAALGLCAEWSAMPASGQTPHPISEAEFRSRLLEIGRVSRAALAKAKGAD